MSISAKGIYICVQFMLIFFIDCSFLFAQCLFPVCLYLSSVC